jgi:hypothetical protein
MSFQDHLKTCPDCREKYSHSQKPTVRIKAASSYRREKKLAELMSVIKGVSYSGISYVGIKSNANTKTKAKGASNAERERQFKLKELGRMVRGR